MEKDQPVSKDFKKQGLIKRLTITGQLTRFIIYLATSISSGIFITLGLFSLIGIFTPINIEMGDSTFVFGTYIDYFLFSIFIFTGVFGIYEFLRLRRIRKIDDIFPDFVRDLAESRRAGMTFTKAIMYASKGNYGILTPEIQKISRQISWGSSVDNALSNFAERVNTKLINRTISLIIEAGRSGGNVADVLDAASKDAREIKLIDSERRAGMISYVAIIYVGLGVFLLIILVLCKSLLPSMLGEVATQASQSYGSIGIGGGGGIKLEDMLSLFFYASLVQSFGMGLVVGVFEEGNIISGLKHTFVMMIITWIIFKFVIMGI
jgi:flagellar protein FlaJ